MSTLQTSSASGLAQGQAELVLDATSTRLSWPGSTASQVVLPLGLVSTGQRFRSTVPTPLELETVIAEVEDIVMPLAAKVPADLVLHLSGPAVALLADQIGHTRAGRVDVGVDEFEAVFNELAALSLGRPLSQTTLPLGPGLSVSVVVIRELLHHLRFRGLSMSLA